RLRFPSIFGAQTSRCRQLIDVTKYGLPVRLAKISGQALASNRLWSMAAVRSVSGIRRVFLLFPSRTRRKSNRAPFIGDKVTSADSRFRVYPILGPVSNIMTAISF